jgi:membrane protein YdbS with pleckstrin-like domain
MGRISDIYYGMQISSSQTRQCPFCAETILAAAVKCRYCGEFLNTERAKAILAGNAGVSEEQSQQEAETLYSGQPSLWAMAGTFFKGAVVLAIAATLIFWHIERIASLKLSAEQEIVFGRYRLIIGLVLGFIVVMLLFFKALQLRMTYYEVSTERIEYGRGIFDRKVDNLDMFRIMDIKLRRNFLDCLVGIGTVLLTTSDKSHPDFAFEKVRDVRELYDAIKKASLSADRRTNVIHME